MIHTAKTSTSPSTESQNAIAPIASGRIDSFPSRPGLLLNCNSATPTPQSPTEIPAVTARITAILANGMRSTSGLFISSLTFFRRWLLLLFASARNVQDRRKIVLLRAFSGPNGVRDRPGNEQHEDSHRRKNHQPEFDGAGNDR